MIEGRMSYRLMFGYTVLAIVGMAVMAIAVAAIKVAKQDTPSPPAPDIGRGYYVVKEGDALSAIAQKTGLTVDRLMELNPTLDPLTLVPGRRIRLRPPAPAAPGSPRPGTPAPEKRVYVVKPGDGLLSIQERTGVPVDRVRSLNPGIGSEPIVPGQRVRLR